METAKRGLPCPACGRPGHENDHYDWRCDNNDCDVLDYVGNAPLQTTSDAVDWKSLWSIVVQQREVLSTELSELKRKCTDLANERDMRDAERGRLFDSNVALRLEIDKMAKRVIELTDRQAVADLTRVTEERDDAEKRLNEMRESWTHTCETLANVRSDLDKARLKIHEARQALRYDSERAP